jgi:hypothetical protein
VHHALLDGQGGVALARALLDFEPKASTPRRCAAATKAEPPSRTRSRDLARTASSATVRQFANLLRALPATMKAATPTGGLLASLRSSLLRAPDSVFNRQVGPKRSYATHVLMENRHGLCADVTVNQPSGTAEGDGALEMLDRQREKGV